MTSFEVNLSSDTYQSVRTDSQILIAIWKKKKICTYKFVLLALLFKRLRKNRLQYPTEKVTKKLLTHTCYVQILCENPFRQKYFAAHLTQSLMPIYQWKHMSNKKIQVRSGSLPAI